MVFAFQDLILWLETDSLSRNETLPTGEWLCNLIFSRSLRIVSLLVIKWPLLVSGLFTNDCLWYVVSNILNKFNLWIIKWFINSLRILRLFVILWQIFLSRLFSNNCLYVCCNIIIIYIYELVKKFELNILPFDIT